MYTLCPTIKLIPTSLGDWLEYGMNVLFALLSSEAVSNARIRWPSVAEMKLSWHALAKPKPTFAMYLRGEFGTVDARRSQGPKDDDANI